MNDKHTNTSSNLQAGHRFNSSDVRQGVEIQNALAFGWLTKQQIEKNVKSMKWTYSLLHTASCGDFQATRNSDCDLAVDITAGSATTAVCP